MKNKLTLDQKYDYYERSVQNAESEVSFMHDAFKKEFKKSPFLFREDFCGTGAISCKWVEQDKRCEAFGVDLDPEPIEMGKKRHFAKLKPAEQKRMHYLERNVLKANTPKMDVICAFNFSYFIFKKRDDLVTYFKSVRKSLKSDGIFFLDIFGGPESQKLVTDLKEIGKDLKYYWECQEFNPITHECLFAIHFRDKKGKHENVFTYDWRFWLLPEIHDALRDAGFKTLHTYWEGEESDGTGNGIFTKATNGENCEAWVAYVGAIP